ncbi:MAG: hypothetical protein HYU84_18775 [Chloroflexi bacterium]|nr:hypothetical protein [Chloroflexota bacterium]MBI3167489.1 hypothetical protein [Chloroflexota bacterium]
MTILRKSAPLALAVLSLVLAGYQFTLTFSSGEWRNSSDEMVSKWEDRVQALHEALPAGVSQVGYVDDAALSGDASQLDVNEFQLMQYSVAPVAIQAGMGHEWIVGNFRDDENLEAWLAEELGIFELQEFGFGLYLIHDMEN